MALLIWFWFLLAYSSVLYPGTEGSLYRRSIDHITCGHIIGPMGEIINLVLQTYELRPAGFTGRSYRCTLPAPTTKNGCEDYNGVGLDPVRPINPGVGGEQFFVYCEEDGYAVIQRREEMSLSFNRSWNDYLYGFGDMHGDHWLGLKKVLRILGGERGSFEITAHFEDGEVFKATFKGDIKENFSGAWFKFRGNHLNSTIPKTMRPSSNGRPFVSPGQDMTNVSTFEANGRYCADTCGGGWWYGGRRPCKGNINGVLTTDYIKNCSPWTKTVAKTQMIVKLSKGEDES